MGCVFDTKGIDYIPPLTPYCSYKIDLYDEDDRSKVIEKYETALVELPKLKGIRACTLRLQGCKLSDKRVKLLLSKLQGQRKMETLELFLTANKLKR